MNLPYEWLLGTRYLRSANRRGFLSFISLTCIAGLMLGVAVLIVVLSVMNGFQKDVRDRMNAVGGEVVPGSAEMFTQLIRSERQRYAKLVREANIQPD